VDFRRPRDLAHSCVRPEKASTIFIQPGAFGTMEHMLAMRVIVPTTPGQIHIHSAICISDNGALVGNEG
jgi:hypothetical protein